MIAIRNKITGQSRNYSLSSSRPSSSSPSASKFSAADATSAKRLCSMINCFARTRFVTSNENIGEQKEPQKQQGATTTINSSIPTAASANFGVNMTAHTLATRESSEITDDPLLATPTWSHSIVGEEERQFTAGSTSFDFQPNAVAKENILILEDECWKEEEEKEEEKEDGGTMGNCLFKNQEDSSEGTAPTSRVSPRDHGTGSNLTSSKRRSSVYLISWDCLKLEGKAFARGGGGQVFRGKYRGNQVAAKQVFKRGRHTETAVGAQGHFGREVFPSLSVVACGDRDVILV